MKLGIPLTDTDRWPWLVALAQAAHSKVQQGRRVVVACSALKTSYRQVLRSGRLRHSDSDTPDQDGWGIPIPPEMQTSCLALAQPGISGGRQSGGSSYGMDDIQEGSMRSAREPGQAVSKVDTPPSGCNTPCVRQPRIAFVSA